ncbi:hypothetical protein Y032_0230g2949 [Ancylostoma ceylanicum]|uniref:Uncharacterized protein n=1 Tax=Ancylostoma ceylanicum TaxID=53326 RepID=A0A016SGQ9_9BILA|nr:hypothetical protein Y032_0230g2949 [Ancylostoma ceylanicum]
MQRLLLLAVLCLVCCVCDDVKNATAQGSYGVQNDYSQSPSYDQGYQQPSYDSYVSYQYIRPPLPPLVDRDVCDLDASVLLVVHSKRHGHHSHHHHDHHYDHHLNRAHRVRCSVIANYDEDSCNICCQHAARRDKKLQNTQFVGFLAVTDDFDGNHHGGNHHHRDHEEGEEELRVKRSHDYHSNKVEPIRVTESDYKPKPYFKNVKCVCCAPKRPLPPPPVFQQPPMYQPPVYQSSEQPSYQQPAQPVYQQAPQSPATYTAPQAPPAQAPYTPPAAAPALAEPTYQAPPAQNPQLY